MNIGTLRDPNTGETYADVYDLIELFKDIRNHPEKYDQDLVISLIGQIFKKIPIEPKVEIPF